MLYKLYAANGAATQNNLQLCSAHHPHVHAFKAHLRSDASTSTMHAGKTAALADSLWGLHEASAAKRCPLHVPQLLASRSEAELAPTARQTQQHLQHNSSSNKPKASTEHTVSRRKTATCFCSARLVKALP
jgi:hypothetical protein